MLPGCLLLATPPTKRIAKPLPLQVQVVWLRLTQSVI
jgi:hypothetical protein